MGSEGSDYRFEEIFRCLPFSRYKSPHLETGDKIVMPPSSLIRILNIRLKYPLLFKMEVFNSDKISHCGVLEFDAEEGSVYIPEWMMKNLNLEEGASIILRNATLSRGLYMKLQPHTTSFIELANPKAVLEKTMRGFSCLSRGDTIMVKHNEEDFYFDVLEVGPGNAISLIETDCEVDFAPPLDYKEPQIKRLKIMKKVDEKEYKEPESKKHGSIKKVDEKEEEGKMFRPFIGRARRLDGEAVTVGVGGCSTVAGGWSKVVVEEGKKSKKDGGKEEAGKEEFKPFTGRSRVLGGL